MKSGFLDILKKMLIKILINKYSLEQNHLKMIDFEDLNRN